MNLFFDFTANIDFKFMFDNFVQQEEDGSLLSSTIPLSSEHINDDGIYLLENGEDALIYIGNMVNLDTVQQLFGVTSVDAIPSQVKF